MNNLRYIPALLAVGCVAAIVGIWSAASLLDRSAAPGALDFQAATVFPVARPLPEFRLIDQDGKAFSTDQLAGKWTLVFMGFTSCGHVCPMTMAKMRAIIGEVEGQVDVLFVSVDPGRDTPELIREYVRSFDVRFRGATGTPEEIDSFANALGAPYFVDTSEDNYIVDHSAAIFLVNPESALAATISAPHDVGLIVSDLNQLLKTS